MSSALPLSPPEPPVVSDLPRRLRDCLDFFRLPELAHLSSERGVGAALELRFNGSYIQTPEEVLIGARLAWRNHARCVGRKHWRSLKLIDARQARTARELAEFCFRHLREATNGGAIQSTITVGPPRRADGGEFRILNSQLIRYAGYRNPDGTVTGDPAGLEITDLALRTGWRGAGTRFDILPLLISTPDEPLARFDIPADLVREVRIEHPDLPWFADLDLKWHALPAVANMDLEIGGVTYPFAPFNGWYVGYEIGARNLADPERYDMLPVVAAHLGLDTSHPRTMWRDRALIELNRAVLHSFRVARVAMVDHHTVAKQFCEHVEKEAAAGRRCPTDWSWINPPLSSGLVPTFHRYFDEPEPELRPNFVVRR
ncbi:nitric oxide synthase oxygenase [Nocardia harenae]|uniref:nitric oxide synthase oxygenase n=1 Tax=Nocardia harenae TaxID=358707 RepID=UPI00082BE91C|nr:nitric oxide synthase oxygenase [Nocardia harenae]